MKLSDFKPTDDGISHLMIISPKLLWMIVGSHNKRVMNEPDDVALEFSVTCIPVSPDLKVVS